MSVIDIDLVLDLSIQQVNWVMNPDEKGSLTPELKFNTVVSEMKDSLTKFLRFLPYYRNHGVCNLFTELVYLIFPNVRSLRYLP